MSGSHIGRRRITVAWLLGFLCLLLVSCLVLDWLDATRRVDRLIHDGWVRLHQRVPPDDVIIAAIDPDSLDQLGRWPWPRELQARLFEELAENGARAVVIDVLYVEPASRPGGDARLAEAISGLPISILPVLVEGRGEGGVLERLPLPVLTREATDLGHIVTPIDDDGIVRRHFLKAGFAHPHWQSLSLAALAAIEPNSSVFDGTLPGTRTTMPAETPHHWVQDHEVLVPFAGPSGSFERVSAARLVRGEVSREEIEGRIVFFGLTSVGLADVVPTPVSALEQPMPGIEMHANVFAALRDGALVTRAPFWSAPLVALCVLPLMLLIYSRAPPHRALTGALAGALLPIGLSFLLYHYARLWYAPLSASVPILVSYLLWSRHRLEFVNRFLESEQAKLAPHLPQRHSNDDVALSAFFEHATRHLPLAGWRFEMRGAAFEGGRRPPTGADEASIGEWCERDGVHSKRYRTLDQLRIDLVVEEADAAREITAYVDSLARVRSHEQRTRPSGTIERLQGNAERLREQMAWLRGVKVFSETVLAGSPLGLAIWNPAGEWVRGNDLVREMLPTLGERALLIDFVKATGHDPGERGERALDEQQATDRERFDALLLDGVPWQVTQEIGERALVVNFSAIGERLSQRLICASVIDVSDIRSAERARAEMVDYLSHDLKSPLVSALALLDDDGDEGSNGGPPMYGAPASVAGNIRRSLMMMDDLLNVARADTLTEESFSALLMDGVLDNALAGLLPQARARRIRFEVESTEEELWVTGDATLIERAIGNVVGNAVKYSPDEATVRVRLWRDGEEAVIEVEDDGVGIDPTVIRELFKRFRREARTAGRISGTGLGLALVARVVGQHAGTVEASSKLGRGTCVTLRLPLERVADADADTGSVEVEAAE